MWLAGTAGLTAQVQQQPRARPSIDVGATVDVGPVSGGWYPWYEVVADPTNPDNLIVCGSKWDAKNNSLYGFVYSSADAGKTWSATLEDKNSTWVSEQSCAFGVKGKAYLVSEASKVIDGEPYHELGTTRIFVSNDAGQTWNEAARTTWADHSSSVVDTNAGPNENHLYTFFNDPFTKISGSTENATYGETRRFSLLRLFTFNDGDKQVTTSTVSPQMEALHYHGSLPMKVMILRDGSLLCVFYAGVTARDGSPTVMIGAVRTDRTRLSLSDPVEIARASPMSIKSQACYISEFAAAYDSSKDQIYLAYPALKNGQCSFLLTTSLDGGITWSKGRWIPQPETMSHRVHVPAMAVNRNGVLGLMWRDEPISDCWYFAASSNHGQTFSPAQALSQCSSRRTLVLTESSAFLFFRSAVIAPASKPQAAISLRVVSTGNHIWRSIGSLIATSDGVFHPTWIETGSGEGQLRTTAVVVGSSGGKYLRPLPLREEAARDITQQVELLYGGSEHYDISSDTLTLDVILKNKSDEQIRAPLLIKAITASGEAGKVEIANASNELPGPGAIWDLSRALLRGTLEPGATTKPYSLVFRIPHDYAPLKETELLVMELKVLARTIAPKHQ